MSDHRESRWQWLLLGGVLLVAVVLRFYHLQGAEFQWDQAEISKWAQAVVRERRLPWIGTWSSTRLDTFPLAIWLMAIPYAVSDSPVVATGFVALLNTMAVLGCYLLTRAWFGKRAALVATLLYAVAPWAVVYSRKIWHTVLLPPFILLYVATGWLAFAKRSRWAVVAHLMALTALVQIHFSSFAFIPLTGLWLVVFHKRLDWRLVLLGGLVCALTFAPYFVLDAGNDWRNVNLFRDLIASPAATDLQSAQAAWTISTGLDLGQLTGTDRYPEFIDQTVNVRWFFVVGGGLTVVGLAIALGKAVQAAREGLDERRVAALMTATLFLAPVLFLTRHNTGVAHHYFTTTFPSQFILAGWFVSLLWERRQRVITWVVAAVVILLACAQGYEAFSILRFVENHHTPFGYGTPLSYELAAVDRIHRIAEERGAAETILLSEGDEPRMYEMPAAADVLLHDELHRAVDVATTLVIPERPAVYWTTREMTDGEQWLRGLVPELESDRVLLREGVRSFRFYHWPGGQLALENVTAPVGGPYTWANGVTLLGYRLEDDLANAGTMRWTLAWSPLGQIPEDIAYHWFNHLLDGRGSLIAQVDGPSMLPTSWRAGDLVLNWFDFDLTSARGSDAQEIRLGMYAYPDAVNIPVRGPDGELQGEWLLIELPGG